MRNRRKDGQLIKQAIKKALPEAETIRVQSGKGTACGWWYIYIDSKPAAGCYCTYESWGTRNTCQPCSEKWGHIYNKAQQVASQSGAQISRYYDDNDSSRSINSINVSVDLHQPEPQKEVS